MKVLIVSPILTHPPNAGNRRRILALAERLRKRGDEVHFAYLPNPNFECGDERENRAYWGARLHILRAYREWDAPTRRRHRIARLLGFAPYRSLRQIFRASRIDGLDQHYFEWWNVQLAWLNRRFRFDTVIVEYVFYSRALEAFESKQRSIIDTHDIFSDRALAIATSGSDYTYRWLSTTTIAEAQGLDRAQYVLAIQEEEAEKFRTMTRRKVITVGHFVATDLPAKMHTDSLPDLLIVGSDNPLNQQSTAWFIEQVLPNIRASLPGARLRLCGQLATALAPRYANRDDIVIVGFVEDLSTEYSRAAVVVNPALSGTGLAIKSIEALAHGCPLVCSPAGARGLRHLPQIEPPFIVAKDAMDMATTLTCLLRTAELRHELTMRSHDFIAAWNAHYQANFETVFGPDASPSAVISP